MYNGSDGLRNYLGRMYYYFLLLMQHTKKN